ncbi:plastid division protein PDV1-like [Macadamia integrifolia]|uniref:plastid division protein PDV1-like n=1 Tax=Macadamia integrifolia TaxID=60698 RepID=UPI001C502442|nr:plastid division protein PDV1-like [Macadamia integrifolia]
MELQEIEAVLEKIWDLHDKISDAIHAFSRSHFLSSIKAQKKSDDVFFSCKFDKRKPRNGSVDDRSGFVFVKNIRVDNDAALEEAKSLNSIRTALENLEDQLEFFHTIQSQQQTERDAAIARLEQSRIILAMRLADHRGQNCKVIEEALAFVGDVESAGRFVSLENLFVPPTSQSGESLGGHVGKRSNIIMQVLASGFSFAKNSLKLGRIGGLLGNAALFTVSMVAFLHLHQVAFKNNIMVEVPELQENSFYSKGKEKNSQVESLSPNSRVKQLDVLSARG